MDRLIEVFCRTTQNTDITKHRSGMIGILYVICLLALLSCASTPSATNGDLGVINLSGDYPTRRVDLKEIADVEYVALETTDSSMMGLCVTFQISDKYIATRDITRGDIFFFTRSGKFIRKISRIGNGPEEYLSLIDAVMDFNAEECFVFDYQREKINVYSFEGVFKRSFPWRVKNFSPCYNYDDNYLIGYYHSFSRLTLCFKDTHPYYLISKKDGTLTPLDITVPNGISCVLNVTKEKLTTGEIYYDSPALPIYPLLMNGDEALIADFSLDTLYSLKEGCLSPIAVKTPTARATTPPTVVAPELFTDSFMLFKAIPMYYDKSDYYKPYFEAEKLIWNRNTNQIEKWDIYNSDIDVFKPTYPLAILDAFVERNMGVAFYTAERLITLYNEGKLKGRLKEVASKLQDEEDNKILLIAKYKQ